MLALRTALTRHHLAAKLKEPAHQRRIFPDNHFARFPGLRWHTSLA